jgi:N-acetylglucosamine kinase-like BadF-type ATPase
MRIVLGFDGGGTKTECVAMDLSGAIVARGRGPASNPTRIGFDAAAEGVKQAAMVTIAAVSEPADVIGLCAGLAGTAKSENHARMLQLLQEKFPSVPIDLRTDLDLSLAAMPPGPAIVLVVGTGSAAVGRDAAGRQLREGGFGRFGSDEGSAFDIGRSAIAEAREQSSKDADDLTHRIFHHLGCVNWQQVDVKSSSNPDEVFPRVFPVVAASADAGNALSQALLNAAAQQLATITKRLANSLGIAEEAFPLGKTGGTIGRSPFFDGALDRALRTVLPKAEITHLTAPAAETAVRIALQTATGTQGASR